MDLSKKTQQKKRVLYDKKNSPLEKIHEGVRKGGAIKQKKSRDGFLWRPGHRRNEIPETGKER